MRFCRPLYVQAAGHANLWQSSHEMRSRKRNRKISIPISRRRYLSISARRTKDALVSVGEETALYLSLRFSASISRRSRSMGNIFISASKITGTFRTRGRFVDSLYKSIHHISAIENCNILRRFHRARHCSFLLDELGLEMPSPMLQRASISNSTLLLIQRTTTSNMVDR